MSGYVGDGVFVRSREAFARAEQWLAGTEAAGLELAGLEERRLSQGSLFNHLCGRVQVIPV